MSQPITVRWASLVSVRFKRNTLAWFYRHFWDVVAVAAVLAMFATVLWIIVQHPAPLYR